MAQNYVIMARKNLLKPDEEIGRASWRERV